MNLKNELGYPLLESSLIIAVLALAIIASIPSLRGGVIAVFQKTGNTLNGNEIAQINTNPAVELPPTEEQLAESVPMQTFLGNEPGEISNNMVELMNEYYRANKEWPPSVKWDPEKQTWIGSEEAWKTMLSWKYPGKDISITEFQKSTLSSGLIYTPNGNVANIGPAPGYSLQFTGTNQETYVGSQVKIEMNLKDNRWYAYVTDDKGNIYPQEIMIDSLKPIEGIYDKNTDNTDYDTTAQQTPANQ